VLERKYSWHLLRRLFDSFTDVGNKGRQQMAAGCFSSCGHGAVPAKIISEMSANDVWPPPSASITALASVLADCNDDDSKETAFLMLHGLMMDGQHHGNLADYRECLVQQHPAVLDSALVYVERMNSKDDNGLHALGFLMTAFDTDPPAAMPTSVWLGLFRGAVRIATHVDSALREFMHSNVVAIMKLVASNTEYVLAEAGDRDELYRGGCISVVSRLAGHISMGPSDEENVAFCARHVPTIVGEDTDLGPHSDRAKIAVRDGLPVALCQLTLACIRHHISQQQVDTFIAFAISILRALVSYGDRVSSWRGTFRPNSVTRSILQHDSVKTMRAAEGHLSRKKGQKQQLTVPKELLDLFAEIESAANERADAQLAAEMGIEDTHGGGKKTGTKGVKGSKKVAKAATSTEAIDTKETSAPSAAAINDTSEDHSHQEHEEDTEKEHHDLPASASPSPPSPHRPSSSAGAPSVSVGGGHGQQQQGPADGGENDIGGGFITVGRKNKSKKGRSNKSPPPPQGGYAQQQQRQQQQANTANTAVAPSSSASTHQPSSHSSVPDGGPRNEAPQLPFPLPPRPPFPPPQAPPPPTPPPVPAPLLGMGDGVQGSQGAVGVSEDATSEVAALRRQLEALRIEKEAIEREKDRLAESTECDICMAEKKSIVLVPCRHFCLCGTCADALMRRPLDQRLCPRCRQKITATKRVYI